MFTSIMHRGLSTGLLLAAAAILQALAFGAFI
jgi:hypothetical protein